MAIELGMQKKLYRNSGTFATPVWEEVTNVTDLTFNLSLDEADITTRANNGWKASIGTLNDGSIDFDMIADRADPEFQAVEDAFINRTAVEYAVMEGDITVSGTQGWRLTVAVINFTRNEPLAEAVTVNVTLKPTLSANAPQQYTVP